MWSYTETKKFFSKSIGNTEDEKVLGVAKNENIFEILFLLFNEKTSSSIFKFITISSLFGDNYVREQQRSRNVITKKINNLIVSSSPKLNAKNVSEILNKPKPSSSSTDADFICDECNKLCASKAGLGSHKRIHKKK